MRTTTTDTRGGFRGRTIAVMTVLAAVIAILGFGLAHRGGATAEARWFSQSPLTNVSVSATNSGNLTAGQPVTFNASATTPNAGATITGFRFNFGDGSGVATVIPTTLSASGNVTTTHSYSVGSSFVVAVEAIDSTNQIGTATTGVTVKGGGQSVAVTLVPSQAIVGVGQPVGFAYTAAASNLAVNFGDGSPTLTVAPGNPITHTYSAPGTFTTMLTATDNSGSVGQATAQVSVTFSGSQALGNVVIVNPPTTASVGTAVTFSAATSTGTPSCGGIQAYRFNFGDNTAIATGQSVSHTYQLPGTHDVTLTVTDCTGAVASSTSAIVVSGGVTQGLAVSFRAGWNLVAGPAGTIITGNEGPLYTYQRGDTAYEVVSSGTPLRAGLGYWAYFTVATTSSIPLTGGQSLTAVLPAGQWVMVGNAGNSTATVSGADSAVIWDPGAIAYVPATQLGPGQGAWAISLNGGTATITNAR